MPEKTIVLFGLDHSTSPLPTVISHPVCAADVPNSPMSPTDADGVWTFDNKPLQGHVEWLGVHFKAGKNV